MSFAARYGPWAVIAGASEGTGRSFARLLAGVGVPSVLVARREAPLEALVEEIREESGVSCVAAAVDLSKPGAADQVIAAAGDREVGLFINNAGSDPIGALFLDSEAESWLGLARLNIETMMLCSHHFGRAMRDRGRGGILLVNSGAAYGGGTSLGVYSGGKAFMLNFAESLWAELRPHGVDVLTLMMAITDTPELRRTRTARNLPPVQGAASPDDVARLGLANLPRGPVCDWSEAIGGDSMGPVSCADRRERVLMIDQAVRAMLNA